MNPYTLDGGDNYSLMLMFIITQGKSFMNEQHFGYLENVIGHTRI